MHYDLLLLEEEIGRMTKFNSKELRNSCSALYIMVIERREVRWAVHVARM